MIYSRRVYLRRSKSSDQRYLALAAVRRFPRVNTCYILTRLIPINNFRVSRVIFKRVPYTTNLSI